MDAAASKQKCAPRNYKLHISPTRNRFPAQARHPHRRMGTPKNARMPAENGQYNATRSGKTKTRGANLQSGRIEMNTEVRITTSPRVNQYRQKPNPDTQHRTQAILVKNVKDPTKERGGAKHPRGKTETQSLNSRSKR